MKSDYNKGIRTIETGYGMTSIRLKLSLAHIYSLMMINDKAIEIIANNRDQNATHQFPLETEKLAEDINRVLGFIIGDLQSPFDPAIWEPEPTEEERTIRS